MLLLYDRTVKSLLSWMIFLGPLLCLFYYLMGFLRRASDWLFFEDESKKEFVRYVLLDRLKPGEFFEMWLTNILFGSIMALIGWVIFI